MGIHFARTSSASVLSRFCFSGPCIGDAANKEIPTAQKALNAVATIPKRIYIISTLYEGYVLFPGWQ